MDRHRGRSRRGSWGVVHQGSIDSSTTTLNYTGQRRDDTGLLYYNARYYDPRLGRFLSPDTLVPSAPEGSMDGVALSPLTVAFHDPAFNTALGEEIRASDTDRDKLHWGGPYNPQDLNRYSYARNNPLRYTDPTGHVGITFYTMTAGYTFHFSHEEATALWDFATSTGATLLGMALGGLEKLGKDGLSAAAWLAKHGASVTVVAIAATLGQMAFTAGEILLFLGLAGATMKGFDWLYGGQGFDMTCLVIMPVCSGAIPPTMERQSGIWHADHVFAEAKLVTDLSWSVTSSYHKVRQYAHKEDGSRQ